MTCHEHLIHGIGVRAPVALAAGPLGDQPVDVDVTAAVDDAPPAPHGHTVVRVDEAAAGRVFTVHDEHEGWSIRFPGAAMMALDRSQGTLRVWSDRDELLSVLLSGPVASILAQLRGHTLLHASAVATGGAAVAFVADRGHGKSSLAFLACDEQISLLSDDALRVDHAESGVLAHRGTTHSRLRATAPLDLSDTPRRSGDGRIQVPATLVGAPHAALAAVVVPVLTAGTGEVRLERLSQSEALRALVAATPLGVPGPSDWQLRHFATCAALARRVPTHVMVVPWSEGGVPRCREQIRAHVEALTGGASR